MSRLLLSSAAVNTGCMYPFKLEFLSFQGMCPGVDC